MTIRHLLHAFSLAFWSRKDLLFRARGKRHCVKERLIMVAGASEKEDKVLQLKKIDLFFYLYMTLNHH